MKYNPLGRTGILVSEICLGTMTWGTQNSEAEAHAQMDRAFERGVNFIDTAELYPTTPLSAETQGETERHIGSWMAARGNRDRVILATKVAGPGRPYIRGGSPTTAKSVHEAVDASLKRLKTDYIDLYQIHWPNRGHYHFRQAWNYHPENQPPAAEIRANQHELLSAMGDLVKAGKVRAVGLSNETAWGIMNFIRLSEEHNLPRVASVQNEYNLLYRTHDLDLAELSHHEDVGLLSFSPLAAGLLSGKYLDGQRPAGSRAALNPDLGGRLQAHQEAPVRAHVEIARKAGLEPAAMALAWCLTRPFMTSIIIGATTMDQLEVNLSAQDITLSPETLREIARTIRTWPMPI